jgi:hypothetical protein
MAIPESGRSVGAAPYSSVMSNYQRPQPIREALQAVASRQVGNHDD